MAELLPRLRLDLDSSAPAPLGSLFTPRVEQIWLEIGFGSGEHLARQAQDHPGVGFIGCEPYIDGVASLLGLIEDRTLANIRIHDGDARDVLDWLPENAIGRVFVLFPDPWPKKRHAKRRLVSAEVLAALARIMQAGAELRIATDIVEYAEESLHALQQVPGLANAGPEDWRRRPANWPHTRYEQKAVRQGRQPMFLILRKES